MIPPNCAHNRRVAGGENAIFMWGGSHNVTSCLLMIPLSSADNNSILWKHRDWQHTNDCHSFIELSEKMSSVTVLQMAVFIHCFFSLLSLFLHIFIITKVHCGEYSPWESGWHTSHRSEVRVSTENQVPWVPWESQHRQSTLSHSPLTLKHLKNLESRGKWANVGI